LDESEEAFSKSILISLSCDLKSTSFKKKEVLSTELWRHDPYVCSGGNTTTYFTHGRPGYVTIPFHIDGTPPSV
jgi:hypothetical protein